MKLQLSYPTNTYLISQGFGANPAFYAQPKFGGLKGHNGLDSIAQHGYPIYATHSGWAQYQVDAGGGCGVIIITDKEYESIDGVSSLWKSIYWHLVDGLKEPKLASPFQDKTGFTKVANGDLIGYADNTGASTGDHLPFALKPCAKGEDWGTFYNVNQNNGFGGAVNPIPYFDGSTPTTIQNLIKQVSLFKLIIEKLKQLLEKK